MTAPLLIDNDVIIKLAQYELIDKLLGCFKIEHSDVYILEELKYVAKLSDPVAGEKFFGSPEALMMAISFYESSNLAEIQSAEIANFIFSLERPDLDQGEQLLLGCLIENENAKLFSGDKRAIRAISKLKVEGIIDIGHHKLLVLEVAIHRLIGCVGFEYVSSKIRLRPDVDTAISICFGRTNPSSFESVLEGLSSYIDDLVSDYGDLICIS